MRRAEIGKRPENADRPEASWRKDPIPTGAGRQMIGQQTGADRHQGVGSDEHGRLRQKRQDGARGKSEVSGFGEVQGRRSES